VQYCTGYECSAIPWATSPQTYGEGETAERPTTVGPIINEKNVSMTEITSDMLKRASAMWESTPIKDIASELGIEFKKLHAIVEMVRKTSPKGAKMFPKKKKASPVKDAILAALK